ncbi:regulator of G-protein signaling 12-like isoform X1 [Carassius auratus]|uniref:Regulator of G-protein signaling 12-like isoform X1 n=1 Tax=Carassius auratus TaxID=7957 RepID=A0A6P6N433_CARAU|nr:regulator of G-protein signaling 12-like isoform X1 [Carassius auratus]XP_026103883.1 regulator of G-protein signaling 12-like isoform X1 [Carassius auratus]XP_026103951.1 regulator of G-protein signaling 12-like isoform X1 [Carassius auratus]
MFRQSEQGRRRVNAQPSARIREVEVARGRTGYGFTLSGQSPCVLNCILKGSPADYVGLCSGDQILSVNDINVSKASHEDVVKLIGRCTGVLYLVIAEGSNNNAHLDSCSSDEELGFHDHKSHWLRPKMDSKTLGINRAERVVAEMQSGGIFNMIFENSSHSSSSSEKAVACASASKTRALSEPDFSYGNAGPRQSDPNTLTEEEMAKVLNDDSVFVDVFEQQDEFALLQNADSAGILNVGMVVGYLGSIELASTSANLESDSLQAIRGCMRRLRAEQKVHSLVLLKVMHDCVQLCNDRGAVLATYPAEKLAFSAVCPDDRRFFGLVTMQATNAHAINRLGEEEQGLRTSCHVFIVDPELCHHKIHQGVARRFGFDCTPDPDTGGCLEFPPTSQPLLQFVSVLYRDMGESIEGMRARAFLDGDLDAQQNNSTSSNSDSGIGNFLPEEKSNRVLLVDLGANPSRHVPTGLWENPPGPRSQSVLGGLPSPPPVSHRNGYRSDQFVDHPLPHPHSHGDPPLLSSRHLNSSSRLDVSGLPSRSHYSAHGKKVTGASGHRWLPVHVRRDWRQGHSSDQESYAESTDGWSSANCSTLPPPMSKIPADRYRAAGEIATQPHRLHARKDEWAKKLFGEKSLREHQQQSNDCRRMKDSEKKGGRFKGITMGFPQRSSGRRSFGRSKRLSMARSLDDLESAAVSDGELNSVDLKGCGSDNSLNSNASLPSVQCHRRHTERRVASWAVCFERLLQDPVGVRYFSEFLKKEFSEENILFWQACEYFSHVPETDKKQLSQRAREIYNSFLSSKATTPVNIDSQAQLADDILNAPRPDMFKEQQLQIFNLMKFDSYTRFLKSYLYQECMLAEVEGRPLPDPYQVPSSPTSKHSTSSDRSNLSTPKKDDKKSKSGRSLNEDSRDEHSDKKKSVFFSWSRNRSFGKGSKKKDLGDYSFTGNNGRRESQGSLSSGASLELATSGSGKNEAEVSRNSMSLSERAVRHCNINLPDGSCSSVPIRPGVSIRELLLGLCEKLGINLAAVDLFLVGGEKPLVLDQDCMTLCSRDLRLEKRTLFRLDLVPINRSVGLKAKPTKPVTEVLRPVVAKYGLNLGDLVARISGEKEPLDLGLPISNLDGLRVVLEAGEHVPGKDKQKLVSSKSLGPPLSTRSQSATGEDKAAGNASAVKTRAQVENRKQKKLNIDEAEEFFELISKAQSNRADDQRGLLNKSNLVLPEFLRLDTEADSNNLSSTPVSHKNRPRSKENGSALSASHQSQSLDSTVDGTAPRRALLPSNNALRNTAGRNPPPFSSSLSPVPHSQRGGSSGITDWRSDGGVQALEEEESSTDLTFVAEGDITSPNSSLLHHSPMPLLPSPDRLHLLREDTFQEGWARSGTSPV